MGVAALCFVLTGISYTRALLAPNSPGWDLRTAEWLRDSHLGWALDFAEWAWLTVHGPSAEELLPTQLSRFPQPFARSAAAPVDAVEPPPIAPVVDGSLDGEGKWTAMGSTLGGVPVLRSTYFRPDRDCADVSVAVARFTPKLTRFVLVPGTRDPDPEAEWRWHGTIPQEQRQNLLAAFNSGYRMRDAGGGIYVEGKQPRPLRNGAATFVIDSNGDLDIVAWDGNLTPEMTAVRQNLRLLVTDGKLSVSLKKKCTKGIDRSGLGVTRDGALLYILGHRLTQGLLAEALQHAGAVRGMQLDAHMQWQSFNVFQPVGGGGHGLVATKLLEDMRQPATRYLVPDDRDFVAAFLR
jgi:hypothetical protein